jgi:3-hydroxyanthranilate 3,4-dioxygenase
MKPLIACNLWHWIEAYRQAFEPPVGHKVIWEDSPFTAMIIRGPHARRDVHVDSSNEIISMLKGDTILEYMQDGRRQDQVTPEGKRLLVPALTPHSLHQPPDTRGLVVEVTRGCTRSPCMSPISRVS